MAADAGAELRSEFLLVLLSRRGNLQVPLSVEQGSPVKNPIYQKPVMPNEARVMESCPRKGVENLKEKLVEENFYLITEVNNYPTLFLYPAEDKSNPIKLSKKSSVKDMAKLIEEKLQIADVETVAAADSVKDEL